MTTQNKRGGCLVQLFLLALLMIILVGIVFVGALLVLDEAMITDIQSVIAETLSQISDPRTTVSQPSSSTCACLTQNTVSDRAVDTSTVEIVGSTCIDPLPCVKQVKIESNELSAWSKTNTRQYEKLKAKGEIYSNILEITPEGRTWKPSIQASFHLIKEAPHDNFNVKIFLWREDEDDWVIVSNAVAEKQHDFVAYGELSHTSLYALVDTQQSNAHSLPDIITLPSDQTITKGECATLSWQVQNTQAVSFAGKPVNENDASRACPSQTTTYQLEVAWLDNTKGVYNVKVTVRQLREPTVLYLPQDQTITEGECATLIWHVQNTQAVFFAGESVDENDSSQACPDESTRYQLEVTWLDGTDDTYDVWVTVNQLPDPIVLELPEDQTITEGECATLSWHVQNTQAVSFAGKPVAEDDSSRVCPDESTRYQLDVAWLDGTDDTYDVWVTVNQLPEPIVHYLPQDQTITEGECAPLSWYVQNTQAVLFAGQWVNENDGREVCPDKTTRYQLDVDWLDGTENTYDVRITVIQILDPDWLVPLEDQWITEGECATLSWHVQNIQAIYFDGVGVGGQDSRTLCPPQDQTYTIEIVSLKGVSSFYYATITVNPLLDPEISFTANPSSIVQGQCTTLFWTVSYAQAVYMWESKVDYQGAEDVCPSVSTTYYLQVVSLKGEQLLSSVQVTVTPPPVQVIYDFVDQASSASWDNDYQTPGLPFPGSDTDNRGFALWRSNSFLEDGSQAPFLLETHPEWINNGIIRGWYDLNGMVLQQGDRFEGRVGFLNGAGAGNVTFIIEISYNVPGQEFCCSVTRQLSDTYNGSMRTWSFAIPNEVVGRSLYGVYLTVEAGSTSAQDWAVWEEARFERP